MSSSNDGVFIYPIFAKFCLFIGLFSFGKRKVIGGQIRWISWLRHDCGVVVLSKKSLASNDYEAGSLWWSKIYECISLIPEIFFCTYSRKKRTICTSYWQYYFEVRTLSWLFCALPLERLGFGFDVITINPVMNKSGSSLTYFSSQTTISWQNHEKIAWHESIDAIISTFSKKNASLV